MTLTTESIDSRIWGIDKEPRRYPMLTPDDLKRLEEAETHHRCVGGRKVCDTCWLCAKLRSSNEALERVKDLCSVRRSGITCDEHDAEILAAIEGVKP
jgi:hypothetical protein